MPATPSSTITSPPLATHSQRPSRSTSLDATPSQSVPIPILVTVVLDAPPAVQAAAFISAAGAIVGGSSVGDAATIATLSMMTCAGKKTWGSNTGPQRLVVSVFYDLGPGAAVLGNIGLALLCYAMQRSVVYFLTAAPPGQDASLTLAARLRYPTLSWALFLFLLPGTLFSSASLLATNDDVVFGPSAAGRAAAGAVSMVLATSVTAYLVFTVATATRKRLRIVKTSDVLCEPHLPRWFLQLSGSWLLPQVMWEPKDLRLRYGAFFSSVASTDALWAHSLLQVHGAVFSLIAAIPFPDTACVAQFVLAIAWMCVPIALVLWWQLRLLRRPPSNLLSLLSSAIIVGVLLATAVYVEGPMSSREAAASARDALGVVLTVVSVVKTALSIVSLCAEVYATRSEGVLAGCDDHPYQLSSDQSQWLRRTVPPRPDAAHHLQQETKPSSESHSSSVVLQRPRNLTMPLVPQFASCCSPRRSVNTAGIDALIDRIVQHSLYAPVHLQCEPSTTNPQVVPIAQNLVRETAQRQRDGAQQFTLKVLITRAAREAKAKRAQDTF
jgi:hypothetical protein